MAKQEATITVGLSKGYQSFLRKQITKEIKEYVRLYNITYAQVSEQQLTGAAFSIMELYYSTYIPKTHKTFKGHHGYKRTYKLKNKSYAPYYSGNTGGVRINQDQSQPYYIKRVKNTDGGYTILKRPASQIWGNSWREGYHGFPSQKIPYETPDTIREFGAGTPQQQLERFCNKKSTHLLVAQKAFDAMKKYPFQYFVPTKFPVQKPAAVHQPKPTHTAEKGES